MNKIEQALYLSRDGCGSGGLTRMLADGHKFRVDNSALSSTVKEIERLEVGMISFTQGIYPAGLHDLSIYPPLLFYRGNPELLNRRSITIVGSREATQYGKRAVEMLLDSSLRDRGISIYSGLAYGIDAHVHSVCLGRGIPTVGVVAGGIDIGYPKGNRSLYSEIAKSGCIVAEFPPSRRVVKGMFPMRNRLLAAMADITIVVEAGLSSGSLITANLALGLGRKVYVVPGGVFSKGSLGCLNLIKSGAGVITSFDDLNKLLVDK